jgi:transcriptional regulator with XRE-family HTH domain
MNILRLKRGEKGWTLEQLAKVSGININTIHYLEIGKTNARVGTIGKLAAALECPFEVLAPLADQVKSPQLAAAA